MPFVRSALRSLESGGEKAANAGFWTGDGTAAAGVHVTAETAKKYSAFSAGVRVISEDLASSPLHVYERLERGKRRASEHPLYRVLHDQANPVMSAMTAREVVQAHALTHGTGFFNIERGGDGHVLHLWPLRPDKIKPVRVDLDDAGAFKLAWRYSPPKGSDTILLADEVLHIPGPGGDGITGYSVIKLAAKAIALGLATEAYGAAFFENGSRPGGVLTHPGAVSEPARVRMRADWENLNRGLSNAQRVAILEEGVTWHQIGIAPEDAQFLETRKFQVTEMARWFRLPPHKLSDLERSTFNNIEWSGIDYVTSALRSWYVRWEQAIFMRLLTLEERRNYFAEHLADVFVRGDLKTRYEAYAIGRNWGWLSADDVGEMENRNPLPGGRGQTYLVPLNMVEAPLPGQSDEDEPARMAAARALRGRGLEARRRIASAFGPLIRDVDERLAKMERAEVGSLVRRILDNDRARADRDGSVSSFLSAVWDLYETVIRGKAIDRWTPVMLAFAAEVVTDAIADVGFDGEVSLDRWVRAYVSSHIDYRVNAAFGGIRNATDAEDPATSIMAKLDEWVDKRPDRTVTWETNQLPNAAAREAYRAAGVRRLRWAAQGDTCPFCVELDGRVVGIDEPFAAAGTEVGLSEKLKVDRKTFHPPLHPGCDCQIVAD